MSRIKLLGTIGAGPALAMLAVLLLLSGLAFPGTARAQDDSVNAPCVRGLELPAELAELDLAGVQAALQALVDADREATVTLLFGGEEEGATIRADLLLADEAVLVALIEGQPVRVTLEFAQGEELPVIVAIEAATAEDCTFPDFCVEGIELSAALTDLDVAGLRAALEGLIAGDADATVSVRIFEDEAVVRADLLIGLADPVLEAVLAGEPLSLTVRVQGVMFEILDIALPGPECGGEGGAPEPEPKPGTMPDNQQDGGKDTTPDNQQGGGDKVTDNQQGGGDTVGKTFELTLNGTVPENETFVVRFLVAGGEGNTFDLSLCGEGAQDECTGDGAVYGGFIKVLKGAQIDFAFVRSSTGEVFHEGTETLDADMTNTAFYTFGKGTGAGDEQEKPDTAAGEVPDNQQEGDKDTDTDTGAGEVPDNQQEDVQDDQQGEMPEELPETGAGGLASGATIPVGNAAAGLVVLVGASYALLRRR
jgi:hypothetical protein